MTDNLPTDTHITVVRAREHNLKDITIKIPRDALVVLTGVSGSGKSSLAFDTIYAEGQRRYVECLSPYARQFLGLMRRPDVDSIEGLSPAISIEQKSTSASQRSTVGTTTEIYDYLRLLFARVGTQYCVKCDIAVNQQTLDQICDAVMNYAEGTKIQILSPVVRARKGHYRELFDQFRRQGFTRVRINGVITELTPGLQVSRYNIHNIEVIVDRLVLNPSAFARLKDSIQVALDIGGGGIVVSTTKDDSEEWSDTFYSTLYSCPSCGDSYEELAPYMFSFNSPAGACSQCDGLGIRSDFDPELIIKNPALSVNEGAILPLGNERATTLWKQVIAFCDAYAVPRDVPVANIPDSKIKLLLYGSAIEQLTVRYTQEGRTYTHRFLGVLPTLRHLHETTANAAVRKHVESYFDNAACKQCRGARLKAERLSVRISGLSIYDVVTAEICDTLNIINTIESALSERQLIIASPVLHEIRARINFLLNVGLGYLSLNRNTRTLSGGEAQRIRLATQIGSQLVGITYVLDEPSIGLHQHDNHRLISSLKELRDVGNTVIVVEHDRDTIESSDYVIDIGPGAGVKGGRVVAAFPPSELTKHSSIATGESLTAQYISGNKSIPIPKKRREGSGKNLDVINATGNNLKNVTVQFPLGTLTCVTGVSGSGKSSLINDTLYPVLVRCIHRAQVVALPYGDVKGIENIDKVIEIDQSPIGRTPRSNPATYTGLFTHIRDFFTFLPESKVRGYKAGRFSFNVKGGRCEDCEGAGIRRIEMNFLPDVFVRCETCNGKRYNQETLQVTFKGYSIANILDMTVDEALDVFSDIPKIRRNLDALRDVGLTYLTLGQQAPTLSGGEAQRVKLAAELSRTSTGKTIYLMDEPTTGLHFEDISILLQLLSRLVDKGNTVIVVEHNLDVIACADYIVDMGPGGGRHGGSVVVTGTPEMVAASNSGVTAQYLSKHLGRI